MSRITRYRAFLLAAVAVTLLAALGVIAFSITTPQRTAAQRTAPSSGVASRTASMPALTSTPQPQASGRPQDTKSRQIQALLSKRADAVRRHDVNAFLATVDPQADPAFIAAQRNMFANLRSIPFSTWSYQLTGGDAVSTAALTNHVDGRIANEYWAPNLRLSYGYAGVDQRPTSEVLGYLFARRGNTWYLESDTALDGFGVRTWRGPWDYGPCQVTSTPVGLIIAHPSSAATVKQIAGQLPGAVNAVTAVWGRRWPGKITVLVPASDTELRGYVGSAFTSDSIAAIAVADSTNETTHVATGQRVVVNPGGIGGMTAEQFAILLRHELTHVATRGYTVDGAPTWMLEGFADYVGYKTSGVPFAQAAPDLAEQVRTTGPPAGPPVDNEFGADDSSLNLAYQQAWSLCRYVATKYGEPTLVRLYQRVAGAGKQSSQQLDANVRAVLGVPFEQLITGWQQYLKQSFG